VALFIGCLVVASAERSVSRSSPSTASTARPSHRGQIHRRLIDPTRASPAPRRVMSEIWPSRPQRRRHLPRQPLDHPGLAQRHALPGFDRLGSALAPSTRTTRRRCSTPAARSSSTASASWARAAICSTAPSSSNCRDPDDRRQDEARFWAPSIANSRRSSARSSTPVSGAVDRLDLVQLERRRGWPTSPAGSSPPNRRWAGPRLVPEGVHGQTATPSTESPSTRR